MRDARKRVLTKKIDGFTRGEYSNAPRNGWKSEWMTGSNGSAWGMNTC